MSKSTVQLVWHARGLKPHRVATLKLSNDSRFEAKLVDVVGLYVNPPEKAVVLCADEKSSVQLLTKHQDVVTWLDKHPRVDLHFTPTSSSWLNLVERWFRELSDKALRRVFHSVAD